MPEFPFRSFPPGSIGEATRNLIGLRDYCDYHARVMAREVQIVNELLPYLQREDWHGASSCLGDIMAAARRDGAGDDSPIIKSCVFIRSLLHVIEEPPLTRSERPTTEQRLSRLWGKKSALSALVDAKEESSPSTT